MTQINFINKSIPNINDYIFTNYHYCSSMKQYHLILLVMRSITTSSFENYFYKYCFIDSFHIKSYSIGPFVVHGCFGCCYLCFGFVASFPDSFDNLNHVHTISREKTNFFHVSFNFFIIQHYFHQREFSRRIIIL